MLAVWLQVHVEVHVARGAKPSYSPSLLPNWDQDGRLSPGCSGVHFDCRRWTLEDFSTASPPPPHRSAHLLFQVQQGVLKKKRTHRDAGMRTNICENRTQDNETGIQESQRVFFFYTRRFERIWKAAIRAESSGGHRAALLCAGRRCRNALSPGTFWLSAHGSHRGGGTQEQNQSVGWKKKNIVIRGNEMVVSFFSFF